MNDQTRFRQIAAISTIAAAVLVLTATIVLSMAVDFNFEFLSNPVDLISAGLDTGAADLFRWGSTLEMFGYFLLLIPATLYLWFWLRPHSPRLVTLYTVLGLFSILLGVIGAAIRASFWPPMMIAYSDAAGTQREVLEIVFRSVTGFTFEGLYALDSILAGLWWLGIGLVLREERRGLGIATTILGIVILGAGVGWLLRLDPLARLELFYFFEPLWAIWLGVVIWRGAERSEQALEAATAA
jgi:hypothetical protein